MMSFRSIRFLRLLTPLSTLASLVAQGIALLTNEWLFSEELISNQAYIKFNMSTDFEYTKKYTVSGLWVLCQNEPGNETMVCSKIDYFSGEEYSPDPNDSTGAIPYAAQRAAIFMLISSAILVTGAFLSLLGHALRRRRVFTFTSGIAFILSGLMILAGMVIYISTFKAEVGNKLRPKSSFQGPLFDYHYGYSFHLAVAGLIVCELAGTFSIFLYIRLHQIEWKQEVERQHYIDYLPAPTLPPTDLPPPVIYCKKHGSRGRRYSRSKELSRETSPVPPPRSSRDLSVSVPGAIPLSESMRDLTYYTFPSMPFSRETTCNTVSTSADINRDFSREFSPRREMYKTEYPPPMVRELSYPGPREFSREFSPRREFSYETLRRTTPV